jgi:hypothetical protein
MNLIHLSPGQTIRQYTGDESIHPIPFSSADPRPREAM